MATCRTCRRTFVHESALSDHLRDSNGHPNKKSCKQCGWWFQNSTELRRHFSQYPEYHWQTDSPSTRRAYPCPDCDSVFESSSDLSNHKNTNHQVCPICSRKLSSAALESHLILTEHYCKVCNKKYPTLGEFQEHRKTSSNHFWCSACDDDYQTAADFKVHCEGLSDHFYCLQCSVALVSKSAKIDHFVKSSEHHYCQKCDADFATQAHLDQHLNSAQDGQGKLIHHYCKLCSMEFDNVVALHSHKEMSSGHNWCSSCKLDFLFASSLQLHFKATAKEHHFCVFCSKKFQSSDELELHTQRFHFWCPVDRECFVDQELPTTSQYTRRGNG
ncbi:putative C2H2-type domain-containing protein [Seiridium cardinale]|uniref:C2H2-type domain-containing protein n=1 Tax=Seiridium cardinale TaxID=138064 RepID=A0ABR2XZL5_9PEZI